MALFCAFYLSVCRTHSLLQPPQKTAPHSHFRTLPEIANVGLKLLQEYLGNTTVFHRHRSILLCELVAYAFVDHGRTVSAGLGKMPDYKADTGMAQV